MKERTMKQHFQDYMREHRITNIPALCKKIGITSNAIYQYNVGGKVSAYDLELIAKFFNVTYQKVVKEYKINFDLRLERPGNKV